MNEDQQASSVLRAVRNGPMREPAHVWLYEVRNATGISHVERYADALVVSVYPSRGLWFAGVEVKVSRSDWLRELKKPVKSEAIQKYCHYWWVAAPPDVVKLDELPKTWGLYEVKGKSAKAVKIAPRLKAAPPDMRFVASVLRKTAEGQAKAREHGMHEAHDDARTKYGAERVDELQVQIQTLTRERRDAERAKDQAERTAAELKNTIQSFEAQAGIQMGLAAHRGGFGGQNLGGYYKTAVLLAEYRPEQLAEVLREAADALTRVVEHKAAAE